MSRILVTGAAGFIGRALCPALARRGHRVIAGLRRAAASPPGWDEHEIEPRLLGDVVPGRDWAGEFGAAAPDIVVHLAQLAHARAAPHLLAGEAEAAAALARAAAKRGARRFVYLSSIKAMGEETTAGRPFRADYPPQPQDAYGAAKLATERALARAASKTGAELVVVRPPLVYGPGVAGNFRALVRLAGSGMPLPFARVANRRSLVAIDNLADLIAAAVVHPAAAGQILLAADGDDLATPRLIRLLAQGQGRTARLFATPDAALSLLRRLPGTGPAFRRLTLSLQVDGAPTRALLGWTPPVSAEAALLAAARAFAME